MLHHVLYPGQYAAPCFIPDNMLHQVLYPGQYILYTEEYATTYLIPWTICYNKYIPWTICYTMFYTLDNMLHHVLYPEQYATLCIIPWTI